MPSELTLLISDKIRAISRPGSEGILRILPRLRVWETGILWGGGVGVVGWVGGGYAGGVDMRAG